jgi:hypothetical protein
MESIEPEELYRNGIMAGTYLGYLANAGMDEAFYLSGLLQRYMEEKLAEEKDMRKTFLLRHAFALAQMSLERLFSCGRVPKRRVPGCLTFDNRADKASLKWQPAWSGPLNKPLFWANGTRSLRQIAALVAAETGEDAEKEYENLSEYFDFLAKEGYIEWMQEFA